MAENSAQPSEQPPKPSRKGIGGRPSKYRKHYCEEIVQHCSDGASLTAYAGDIGVSRDTLNEWAAVYPEFSEAMKRAKAAAASWHDKRMRENLQSGKGSAVLSIFALKNFAPDDFKDVQERHHTGGIDHYVVALPGKSQDAGKWIEANRPDVPVLPDLRDDDGEE